MAIQTVNASNLNEYVAERQAQGATIQTSEQMVAVVDRIATAQAKDRSPVIATGEETVSDAPKPNEGEPTAKAQAEKAKAGTDPGVQKRIDAITREKKELEEAFESEYIARIEAERKLRDAESKPVEAAKVEEAKRPRLSDFKTAEEFDTAMDVYEAESRKQIQAQAEAAARLQASVDRANEELGKRYQQARADIGDDFDEVIAAANEAKLTPSAHIQAALREGEYGVHMAYYLAKHPDELKRLEALSPVRAVAEIGRMELKFVKAEDKATDKDAKAEAKPPIETTRAPAPIASVKAETGTVRQDLSGPMAFSDYKQSRLTEIRRKRH